MFSAIAAYLLVWAGLLFYVVRLGTAQRRLARAVEELQRRLPRPETAATAPRRSAFSGKRALT
jgi:CcmD family protein